jgi:hypothetical protein
MHRNVKLLLTRIPSRDFSRLRWPAQAPTGTILKVTDQAAV